MLDTKSKNIKFTVAFKLFALVLAGAGIFLSVLLAEDYRNFPHAFDDEEYENSGRFRQIRAEALSEISPVWFEWPDRAQAEAGAYVTEEAKSKALTEILGRKTDAQKAVRKEYYETYWFLHDPAAAETKTDESTAAFRAAVLRSMEEELKALDAEYPVTEEALRAHVIKRQTEAVRARDAVLQKWTEKFYYRLEYDGRVLSNVPSAQTILERPAVFVAKTVTQGNGDSFAWEERRPEEYDTVTDGGRVLLAPKPEFLAEQKAEYEALRSAGRRFLTLFMSGCVLTAAASLWLLHAAGRRPEDDGVHLAFWDLPPMEFSFFFAGATGAGALFVGGMLWRPLTQNANFLPKLMLFGVLFAAYLAVMLFLTTAAKRLKRREFLMGSLTGRVLFFFWRIVGGAAHTFANRFRQWRRISRQTAGAGDLKRRLLLRTLFFAGGNLFCALLMLRGHRFGEAATAFVVFAILNLSFYKREASRAGSLRVLAEGVRSIRGGDLNRKIPVPTDPETAGIAEDVNAVTEGLKIAVENELKSERMKMELITNVSHDIKTPLTSLVNYATLLSEENLPAPAGDYVRILREKTLRLKNLIDDLFLVSKAQSGAVEVHPEPLCLNDMAEQALAEFADEFEEKRLQPRLRVPAGKVTAVGDGSKMWRVLSNLLSNAVKYGLPGTRVYLDVFEEPEFAGVSVRNVAGYEMNFDPSEITARFVRGDPSRTGEGSGLGLSIAESFMKLQGGDLKTEIDGDVFKITVRLPKTKA